jgi:hypothetical protein
MYSECPPKIGAFDGRRSAEPSQNSHTGTGFAASGPTVIPGYRRCIYLDEYFVAPVGGFFDLCQPKNIGRAVLFMNDSFHEYYTKATTSYLLL